MYTFLIILRSPTKKNQKRNTALARTPWPGATATARQGQTVPMPDSLGCHPSEKTTEPDLFMTTALEEPRGCGAARHVDPPILEHTFTAS